MYDKILFITFISLVLFFLAIEIYRFKYSLKGTLINFSPSKLGVEELIVSRLQVKLRNGDIIEAEAMRCTMCLGHFSIGDEVQVTKSKDKYLVNLPLKISKRKSC